LPKLRIATWNVNRPISANAERRALIQEWFETIDADIWVLTESFREFAPGEDYNLIAATDPASDLSANECWTAIWVRGSMSGSQEKTTDKERTACAQVLLPNGQRIYVYGTVLPWMGSQWKGFPSADGKAFTEALAVQKADWHALRHAKPGAWLFVAGNFNQDLLQYGYYYGSNIGSSALKEALGRVGLKCLTGGELDPVAKLYPGQSNIDHICLAGNSTSQILGSPEIRIWPTQEQKGKQLSDHFGIAAEIHYT